MGVAVPGGTFQVDLFLADPRRAVAGAPEGAGWSLLSADERRSLDATASESVRRERLAAALLGRWALARELGLPPADVSLARDSDGRPRLVSPPGHALGFSLAHTRDLVVCGVARGAGVGVDVERLRPHAAASAIARRFFCADEARRLDQVPEAARSDRFWALWTLKEALVKAAGLDLFDGLGACAFRLRGRTRHRVEHAFPAGRLAPSGSWRFALLAPTGAHFVAVAARTDGARRLAVRVDDATEAVAALAANGSAPSGGDRHG